MDDEQAPKLISNTVLITNEVIFDFCMVVVVEFENVCGILTGSNVPFYIINDRLKRDVRFILKFYGFPNGFQVTIRG